MAISNKPHTSVELVTTKSHDDIPNQWSDGDNILDTRAHVPGTTSRLASLQRELKCLETRYFRTRLQLEKTSEQNHTLRIEMTKIRSTYERFERENQKLRRLIDRIQYDKKQIEVQAITNRDYAHKIEHQFFMGHKGQSLVQSNLELITRLKQVEKEKEEKEKRCQTIEKELTETREKLGIVKRALETRFEELQLNGSLHNGILYELATLQDQTTTLALQLNTERTTIKGLETELENMKKKHLTVEENLVIRETWIASLEKERAELQAKLQHHENDQQTLAFEKATLLRFIQEQAEVKLQIEAQGRQRQDEFEKEITSWRLKWEQEIKEKETLQQVLKDVRLNCETLESKLYQSDKNILNEQCTNEELRTRQHELFMEIQRLQDEWKHQVEECTNAKQIGCDLQTRVDTLEHEHEIQQTFCHELETTLTNVRQQLVEKEQEGKLLRIEMEKALQDLDTLSKQKNEAARAMNEAVTISASSLEEQQTLENKVVTQRKQLEQLKHSKNMLQNAMLEQLSALRKQLQTERMQRVETEAKLKQYRQQSNGQISPHYSSPAVEEHLKPLPPPEISFPSPLPPHLSMMQLHPSDEDASSEDEQEEKTQIAVSNLKPSSISSSDCGNISLLELAGDFYPITISP